MEYLNQENTFTPLEADENDVLFDVLIQESYPPALTSLTIDIGRSSSLSSRRRPRPTTTLRYAQSTWNPSLTLILRSSRSN